MRINNNIMAINTHRQYTINNNSISKSMEKLSSGYRINRAGDDAAGLAISEKMRAQIRGLNMASKNSQDAISLVQTAEGALQETHNILQRMRELAVQSSSDTNETVIDRGALEAEFKQLISEIDDTANKAKFNEMGVIDGTFAKTVYQVASLTAIAGLSANIQGVQAAGAYDFKVAYVSAVAATSTAPVAPVATGDSTTGLGGNAGVTAISFTPAAIVGDKVNGKTLTLSINGTNLDSVEFKLSDGSRTWSTTVNAEAWKTSGTYDVNFAGLGTMKLTTDGTVFSMDHLTASGVAGGQIKFDTTGKNGTSTPASPAAADITIQGETVRVFAGDKQAIFGSGVVLNFNALPQLADATGAMPATALDNIGGVSATGHKLEVEAKVNKPLTIQSGANRFDELKINIDRMDSGTLGVKFASIATGEDARRALTYVNTAVNRVSTQRAALGALQNRLNHKIANLDTSAENLQAAESRIRDVDMAKEMTIFTRNNILSQASTAMLAQANSAPQGVLQLLR